VGAVAVEDQRGSRPFREGRNTTTPVASYRFVH
jgi:hypothetical protein